MTTYEEKLAYEAVSVGLMTAGLARITEIMFPRLNSTTRLFLVGALFHLGAEYYGMNEWYLTNSAAFKEYRRKNPKEKLCPTIRNSECQFTSWEESDSSCFLPQ
jgi:hypothetical protein